MSRRPSGRGILTVVRACLAQARRQLADDTDGVHGRLGRLAAAVLRQVLRGPPLGGLPQPGLADAREVAAAATGPRRPGPTRPCAALHRAWSSPAAPRSASWRPRTDASRRVCLISESRPGQPRVAASVRRSTATTSRSAVDQGPDSGVGAQLQAQQQLQLHLLGQPLEDHEVVGVDRLGDPHPPPEVRSRVLAAGPRSTGPGDGAHRLQRAARGPAARRPPGTPRTTAAA